MSFFIMSSTSLYETDGAAAAAPAKSSVNSIPSPLPAGSAPPPRNIPPSWGSRSLRNELMAPSMVTPWAKVDPGLMTGPQ